MSTLTIALAAVGGVVLAGIVAQGAWATRKAGPKRAAAPIPSAEPREPVMDPVDGAAVAPADPDAIPVEAGAAPQVTAGAHPAEPAADLRSTGAMPDLPLRRITSARLDALIDAIATLRLESPISGAFAISHLPPTRRAGGKPFLIEGLNTESGEWEPPQAEQHYGELQAGVQLANRTGALNEIEFSEFVQKIQAFADAVGAMPDFPDMLEAVASARELDHFAGDHDAQLAVRLRARGAAWSVGYIQQVAGQHGFVPGVVPGRFVMPSNEEGSPPVLTLTFDPQAALADEPDRASVSDVTLSFDVPQTEAAVNPFAAWHGNAHALATRMEARVVDDAGRELSDESFTAIGAELGQLYAALEGRELAAGSAAARRLFS